ncbi:hypothetical protein DCAR_0625935 [Daucus carota subsp. sativus]|uniref:Uncharacterized protein n=1 Tax=Daucus carota subsp. sativus TaxID=79200 RepID=A0A161YGI5_DAUCS|nr:PREDICTED: cytochrome P450 93A3-like [Daucus carota subsp. sativus]WOH06507.1 hypothetical protein DCAR_0625935 [Daucus carota subsp. sativus]
MADYQGYIVIFLFFVIPVIVLQAIFKSRKNSRLPPGPLRLPIIGHLHLLGPIPHQAFHKLSIKYGPLVHVFAGSNPCVIASSPEMAKEFLKINETSWSDRPQNTATDYLGYGSQDFTFAPYGPYWKFVKKLCMSELLGGRSLDLFQPVRRQEICSMVNVMLTKAKAGVKVDIGAELMRLNSNVLSRMIMRERCSENEDEAGKVKTMIKEVSNVIGIFNLGDYIWFCKKWDLQGIKRKLVNVRGRYDLMMDRIIQEHRDVRRKRKAHGVGSCSEKDLLDILLDISEDETMEIKLSIENIKAFILDVFSAGTDTTAILTEWAVAELINHPDIMQKAVQELDTVVGTTKLVEESDVENLPYLQAIFRETARLHPVAPLLFRQSSKDCSIADYHIPAKTGLFVNNWALGRDPDHWESPLEFKPERFLLGTGKRQLDVKGGQFHFLPFGSGQRGCPGSSLALHLVQTSLAAIIQCFELKAGSEGDLGDGSVDMEEAPGLTLPRAHPLVCSLVARPPFACM